METIVRKAIFPVAGMGTRFLPATKANPKEMLPVVDKPLIQYAVEEAISAGITELIFVTNSSKRAIEDHFDTNFELEYSLKMQGKLDLLRQIQDIVPDGVNCIYVRQSQPKGLGHAVLCAQEVVGDEPFAVLLADDLIVNHGKPCLQQMLGVFDETQNSVIAVQEIESFESEKYGVVDVGKHWTEQGEICQIIEKPKPFEAPSNLGVVGRYVLTPEIFDLLQQIGPGANNEIQLTDAISALLQFQPVQALQFAGKRYDCGSKLGYLQASVILGLQHPEFGQDFREFLDEMIDESVIM